MTTACCPPAALPLHTGAASTGLATIAAAWTAWRERVRQDAAWRALDELDDGTRRDLGLPERGTRGGADRAAGLWQLERGSW